MGEGGADIRERPHVDNFGMFRGHPQTYLFCQSSAPKLAMEPELSARPAPGFALAYSRLSAMLSRCRIRYIAADQLRPSSELFDTRRMNKKPNLNDSGMQARLRYESQTFKMLLEAHVSQAHLQDTPPGTRHRYLQCIHMKVSVRSARHLKHVRLQATGCASCKHQMSSG